MLPKTFVDKIPTGLDYVGYTVLPPKTVDEVEYNFINGEFHVIFKQFKDQEEVIILLTTKLNDKANSVTEIQNCIYENEQENGEKICGTITIKQLCTNGAINYPECDDCGEGKHMDENGKCVSDLCANGAINYPECDDCGEGKHMDEHGKCVSDLCANGAINYPECDDCGEGKHMDENGRCVN